MPSLKYHAGRLLHGLQDFVLSRSWLPIWGGIPIGTSWAYDLQRFAGRRDLACLIDAGANVGQTAAYLRSYFPRTQIHSFEPVRASFLQLQAGTKAFPNVHCRHAALGAARAQISMRLQEDSENNSLFAGDLTGFGSETVEVETLDAYCDEAGIGQVDLLKMDVQGYELQILRGAERLLAERRISFVYSEIGFSSEQKEIQDFSALHQELVRWGFSLAGFYEPFRWGPHKRILGFCSALYTNPAGLDRAGPPGGAPAIPPA